MQQKPYTLIILRMAVPSPRIHFIWSRFRKPPVSSRPSGQLQGCVLVMRMGHGLHPCQGIFQGSRHLLAQPLMPRVWGCGTCTPHPPRNGTGDLVLLPSSFLPAPEAQAKLWKELWKKFLNILEELCQCAWNYQKWTRNSALYQMPLGSKSHITTRHADNISRN